MGQQFSDTPGFNLHGHLDNVSIYNYPLNPQQIEESRFVSLPEIQTRRIAKVYPNPTNNRQVNVTLNEPLDENFSAFLVNNLGQKLSLKSYTQLSPDEIGITLPDPVTPGYYSIVISTSQKVFQARLICIP